jgi:hypothetical protein
VLDERELEARDPAGGEGAQELAVLPGLARDDGGRLLLGLLLLGCCRCG